ncbi:MAG: glycoside hydrolase family 32 protein [Verrucomicrobia bacterium]|nr:glycoside hydrolase family 32 protein [Verrucomicrobiota bacterium]
MTFHSCARPFVSIRLFASAGFAWCAVLAVVQSAELQQTAATSALFTEDFNGEVALIGRNSQAQTFLPVKHGNELPGWTKQGDDMPAHWVEQYPGNWALMLVANRAGQNVFTQIERVAANAKGHVYTVSLDAGAAVHAGLSQATAEGDQIAVDLLRSDGTVLKKHLVTPGKWSGRLALKNQTFSYEGDGSGPLRFMISPVYTSGVRFFGAIDHLQIFSSTDAATAAIAARQAVEKATRVQAAEIAEARRQEGPHASQTPKFTFAETLAEQEKQLKSNLLMRRFAESRKHLAADRYRPAYHFVSPESQMNDPNGLCFWQGRWHLFYQGYPPDEFPNPADIPKRRQHWGHAVSNDLIHWRDLPYAIYPGIERMCFSGSTVVESNQVVAFYPGIDAGQMVAIAKDPLLLNWEKIEGNPVKSPAGDSCIWKEGDTYFGLVGASHLVSSSNLVDWTVHSGFLEANPFPLGDAGACPNFVPLGNKHLLLSFSHTTGGQYLLGDYDPQGHRFKPYAHGRLNHGTVSPGGVHAPSAAADGKGGVININNINDGKPSPEWDQIMSLPQQLTLGPDSQLRIEPVEAIASLRGSHQRLGETILPANREIVLDAIKGNTLELEVEIDPQMSRWVQLNVLRSPNAEEQTSITFYNFDRKLSIWYDTKGVVCLDGLRSSTLADVWLRPPERAVMERGTGPLKLRVFVDRSVVEVFVNGKLYLALRVYPSRQDSVGVSLRAQGQDAVLKKLDAWQLQAIWQ